MIKLNDDCLILIFNKLQTDKKFLHSCLLVNREWCRLIVPILWKNLFYNYEESVIIKKNFFSTILSHLSTSSKQILFDNDIKLLSTILPKPLSFNYIQFCRFLDANLIDDIMEIVKEEFDVEEYNKINLLEQEIYKLFISQSNIKELIWKTWQPLSLFPGASTCFSQLNSLTIDIKVVSSDAIYEMAKFCKDLNKLIVYNCYQNIPELISLIDVQKKLKSVTFYSSNKKVNHDELSKAIARKGNTINDLSLYSASIIPPSFLKSLVRLKNISIICNYDDGQHINEIKELQQYLEISAFPELQSLNIYGLSCFKEFSTLIEKTMGNILEIFIDITDKTTENTGMLINSIANNCPKIERLCTYIKPKDFVCVKSLLKNCNRLVDLRFDSTDFNDYNDNYNYNIGDELLNILTKSSPKSLTEITISDWKYSIDSLEQFFQSCKMRTSTLNRFNIIYRSITEDRKIIIRKYINEGVIMSSNYL